MHLEERTDRSHGPFCAEPAHSHGSCSMADSKQKKVAQRQDVQQPTHPMQDEEDSDEEAESEVDVIVDGELDKDETEEELERLVFGDSVGFRHSLKDVHMQGAADGEGAEAEDEDADEDATRGMQGLDDAQVGGIAL